jgi:hypothetical protein
MGKLQDCDDLTGVGVNDIIAADTGEALYQKRSRFRKCGFVRVGRSR